jgi:hypothetical protein
MGVFGKKGIAIIYYPWSQCVGKTTVMHEPRNQLPEFVLFSTDNDNFGTTAEQLYPAFGDCRDKAIPPGMALKLAAAVC